MKLFATSVPAYFDNIQPEFGQWVEDRSLEFVQIMMMTLPSPRHNFYQSSNYDEIQLNVLTVSNSIIEALGTYPVEAKLDLLGEMEIF